MSSCCSTPPSPVNVHQFTSFSSSNTGRACGSFGLNGVRICTFSKLHNVALPATNCPLMPSMKLLDDSFWTSTPDAFASPSNNGTHSRVPRAMKPLGLSRRRLYKASTERASFDCASTSARKFAAGLCSRSTFTQNKLYVLISSKDHGVNVYCIWKTRSFTITLHSTVSFSVYMVAANSAAASGACREAISSSV